MEVYAKPLLDQLDPNQEMFRERYYREECTFDPSLGVYVKDLQRAFGSREVDVDEKRVVLIDNNPMSFLANPLNGILVCNFYDDPKDETLRAVMDLLVELEQEEDVRPFLDDKFGLKDALKEAVSAPNSSGWM
jgi:TFIIF-interacting CTD phosphatase-like protein